MGRLSPARVFLLMAAVVVVVAAVAFSGMLVESLNADQIMVVQSPVQGTLTWYTTPGWKWQGFGKITKFQKREQFWFSLAPDQGRATDQSIPIRFNDGGHAKVSGGISWEMPVDDEHLTLLLAKYGSAHGIESALIRPVIEKSVYLAGPLMSSTESYAARRAELLGLIEDQILRGVYKSETMQVQDKDPITGVPRTVTVVKLVRGKDGQIERQEASPIAQFGVRAFNLLINNIIYDKSVEAQIEQQQQAIMNVQTAIANAKKAEQDVITTVKQGEAKAATARWEQEAIKAQQVTAAEQRKDVARLDADAAEQKKREQILLGEGEAARKRLVMDADGALQPKLDALVAINKEYAKAIAAYQGNWVPSIVNGSGAGQAVAGSGAMQMLEILSAKAAKDLAIDMSVSGTGKTAGKK